MEGDENPTSHCVEFINHRPIFEIPSSFDACLYFASKGRDNAGLVLSFNEISSLFKEDFKQEANNSLISASFV